jgi:spheroidene monooxygenase
MLLVQMAPEARLWGSMRLVVGRFAMWRVPGLRFFKILGSGHEGGFGLRPSADRLGLFTVFADAASADAFLAASPVLQSWRSHSRECAWLKLVPYSSRGAWAGRPLAANAQPPGPGPIAVLTRASIRPWRAAAFWRRAPAAERSLHEAAGCLLATGLGEAPVLRQATFSVWQDTESLHAYAQQGAHLEAVRAAYGEGYFSESMFTRFSLLSMGGTWKGRALA